jgi:hypothetical protein
MTQLFHLITDVYHDLPRTRLQLANRLLLALESRQSVRYSVFFYFIVKCCSSRVLYSILQYFDLNQIFKYRYVLTFFKPSLI